MSADPINSPVDFVLLGGQRTPGIATVENADSPRKWEEKSGRGVSGARLKFTGRKGSHFSIKLRLLTAQHWAEWATFKTVVLAIPTSATAALDIVHPFLADLGIRSVVIENVGQPVPDETGVWTIEIKVIEQIEPTPGLATARGSRANGAVSPPDTDAILLDANTNIMRAEAAQL